MIFDKRSSNKEMLRIVHQSNIAAIAWQHASLREVQKRIGKSNICDTLFLFQPDTMVDEGKESFPLELVSRDMVEESKTQVCHVLHSERSPSQKLCSMP